MGTEIPWDGVDQDGYGSDLDDIDADGFIGALAGGPDCNDHDARVGPGAYDRVGDGVDADCDGWDGAGPPQAGPGWAPWGGGLAALVVFAAVGVTARRWVRARPSSRSAPRQPPAQAGSARPA